MPAFNHPSNTKLTNLYDLELFFELSPDLVCIAGYDGYFKRVNPAVVKTLGYSREELFAAPIDDFVYHEDKDVTTKSRENLKRSIPLMNFENRYLTKEGEIVWLSWTSVGVDDQQVVFAIAKNITHKKRLEEDRNSLLTNLTKINGELKQLIYTMAHDLRSPVNNLLTAFSMMDISKINDAELSEYLYILKASADSLGDTLNNYVDTIIQKKSLNIQVEPVSLSESFNSVVKSLQSLIADSGAKIKADFSAHDVINFNKAYLESIFLNLVTNSIKYARPNTFPEIFVSTKQKKHSTTLIFKDKGMGFDMPEVKDKIFGFKQTFHNHEDSKGIGLYLVYNHLTSLGGDIAIKSQPDKGAEFIISFKG